jgi:hypothetical protein
MADGDHGGKPKICHCAAILHILVMVVVKKYTATICHGRYLTTLMFDFSLNQLPKLKSCPLLMTIIVGFHFFSLYIRTVTMLNTLFCSQVHEMAMVSAVQEAQKDNLRSFNDYMMKVLEVSVILPFLSWHT